MIGRALAVAGLGWRALWRDPLGLVFTFLLPVAVAAVMIGVYTSQAPGGGQIDRIGVLTEDGGAIGRDVVARLGRSGLEVHRYDHRSDLERAVRRRDVAAGLVVPAGLDEPDRSGSEIELLGPPEIALPRGVRATVETVVAGTASALQVGRAHVPDAPAGEALRAGNEQLADLPAQRLDEGSRRGTNQGVTAAAVIATLVLFVFMNTMAGSSSLAHWRELGVLARLRTTRATPLSVSLGYGLGLTSYALMVALVVLLVGRVGFGLTWWSWPGLLAALTVVALAAGGAGVVIGALLPSPESGVTVAGPIAFVLGALGGCLWPLDFVGPTLRVAGHATPQAWAVDALSRIGVWQEGLGAAAGALAVLGGMAVVLLAVGCWRVRRLAERA